MIDQRPRPSELGFEPHDLGFIANPSPAYARLRETAPVVYDETTDHWLVSRHADVDGLLRDRRLGRTYLHRATHAEMGQPEDPAYLEPFWFAIRNGILDMEPPRHTLVRRLVSKAFTPRMVERLRPHIERITEGLVEEARAAGEFDLLAVIAEPLPVTVIAEMLGVPEADRPFLRPWSAQICGMYELNPTEEAGRIAATACLEFSQYLRDLLAERRNRPGDDLVSALSQVVDEGDALTEDELVGTCILLLNAGHEPR